MAIGVLPLWRIMKMDRVSADELLERMFVVKPPIDIEAIARKLEIEIRRVKKPGWSGACQSTKESVTIWINEDEAKVRQRFTIAHEIGHLILHPLGEVFRDTTFEGGHKEAQANRYAADLLMPYWLLHPMARASGYDAATLAKVFNVSKRTMEIRLISMGGIEVYE